MCSFQPQQMYNVFPRLMELLPGRHHAMFTEIEDVKHFVMGKIKEHEQNLDFEDPRDFIDCFLIRLKQVSCILSRSHLYAYFYVCIYTVYYVFIGEGRSCHRIPQE